MDTRGRRPLKRPLPSAGTGALAPTAEKKGGAGSFRRAAAAPLAAVLIGWGLWPLLAGDPPAEAGAALRPDAAVEILKPDGSVAAALVAEIADTPELRARGLMGRPLTDYLAGMLFLFEAAQEQTFWMRNTPSSLDMIFADAAGKILNIAAYTTPMSDRLYSSAGAAKFVLETKAGFADRYGVLPGHTLRWRRLP